MPRDKKAAASQTYSLERAEKAGVHRLYGPALPADGVIMVAIGKAEVSDPVSVDLFNETGGVQPGQCPVHCHQAQIVARSLRPFPNHLTGGEVGPGCEGPQDRQALPGHPQARLPKQ